MPPGRPLKFKSVQELEDLIEAYFKNCEDNKDVPTITGLAVELDTTRRTLIDYEEKYHEKDQGYSHAIKKAKARIEAALESNALANKVNPTIAIFSLKNNYGWKDRTEIDSTAEITHKYESLPDDELDRQIKAREDRLS